MSNPQLTQLVTRAFDQAMEQGLYGESLLDQVDAIMHGHGFVSSAAPNAGCRCSNEGPITVEEVGHHAGCWWVPVA